MNYIGRRFSEPSTYVGLGMVVTGFGMIFGFDTSGIGGLLADAGPQVAHDGWTGVVPILGGLLVSLIK